MAAAAAALLSLVTRRTRGMYFVIVTFAALQLLGVAATTWSGLTGGSQGLALPLPTWSLSYQDWPFYYPMLGLLVVTVAVSAWVRRGKLGLGLFAIRDDEDKAAGLGLRTAVYKMIAFVLGGAFVGIAGGIYAYYVTFLNTAAVFDIVTSVLIVLAVLLGGRGTVWGPGARRVHRGADQQSHQHQPRRLGRRRHPAAAVRRTARRGRDLPAPWRPAGPVPAAPGAAARAPRPSPARSRRPMRHRSMRRTCSWFADCASRSAACARSTEWTSTCARHEITGLIGPNGSGKTTLFNLIDGTIPSRDGSITLGGRSLDRAGRPARAHAGLARTYQLPRLFGSLTVVENLVVPERRFAFGRLWASRVTPAERDRAMTVLDNLGLAPYADSSPADLSYGQRKLVELAQVLWLDPVLVMLDEPAAGISPALSERLADLVRSLHQRGIGVLLVEHDLAFIADLCQRVYVMAHGTVIAQGSVAEVSADAAVVDAYLGDSVIPVVRS